MHPHIWTVPGINYPIRAYGLMIVIGIVLALWIAWRRAKRADLNPGTITSMGIVGVLFGIIGCRIMHFTHYWKDEISSGEISVSSVLTASSGGEIVGGIVLAVVSVMVYLKLRGKPVGRYLDVAFPPMILAMGVGRVGCFMFGCCWGGMCETNAGARGLPWAVQFPYGSPAFERAWDRERVRIPPELTWKIPKTDRLTPIPRAALTNFQIDGDVALERFALTAERAAKARKADPESAETKKLIEEMKEAGAALGRKPSAMEVLAVVHLRDMREAGNSLTWEDLRVQARSLHSPWVHPAQLYDAISLGLLFVLLTAIYYRRHRPGTVVAWGMMLYGVNRFLQEMIRGDNPADTFGFTISQFVSIVIVVAGLAMVLYLRANPPKSAGVSIVEHPIAN